MIYIKIKKTKNMGWGVFASRDFKSGELIETCPSIPLTKSEVKAVTPTRLENWFFEWRNFDQSALVMGYGMIYNHSSNSNAAYKFNFRKNTVIIKSTRPIKKNHQIFLNYNQYRSDEESVDMFDPVTKKNAVYRNGKISILKKIKKDK